MSDTREHARAIERQLGIRVDDCPECGDAISPNGKCIYCEYEVPSQATQAPKDERTWRAAMWEVVKKSQDDFDNRFPPIAIGYDGSEDDYKRREAHRDFLSTEVQRAYEKAFHTHTTALAEEMVREIETERAKNKEAKPADYIENVDEMAYDAALVVALAIIRKHLTPDNPTEK